MKTQQNPTKKGRPSPQTGLITLHFKETRATGVQKDSKQAPEKQTFKKEDRIRREKTGLAFKDAHPVFSTPTEGVEDPKMTIPYRHLRFLLSIPSRTSVIQHRVYRNPRDTVKRYSNNLSDTCDSRRVGRHTKKARAEFSRTIQYCPQFEVPIHFYSPERPQF